MSRGSYVWRGFCPRGFCPEGVLSAHQYTDHRFRNPTLRLHRNIERPNTISLIINVRFVTLYIYALLLKTSMHCGSHSL